MRGYGVCFGDSRDMATYVPLDEEQTNIRGELRASLCALEGHKQGEHTLVCPDCLLIVNGMLGRAQKWRRHSWTTAKGLVQHRLKVRHRLEPWLKTSACVWSAGDCVPRPAQLCILRVLWGMEGEWYNRALDAFPSGAHIQHHTRAHPLGNRKAH